MKPLLMADTFRSKAIELKPAHQPFLSLIRKCISVWKLTGVVEGSLMEAGWWCCCGGSCLRTIHGCKLGTH